MLIQEIELDKIIPYQNNARVNDSAIKSVCKSLQEFGWQQPIVVDKQMTIIVGHTRLKAAQKLGYKTAPVKIEKDLSPDKVRMYRLQDNNIKSEWDFRKLEFECADLAKIFDFKAFDFDPFGTEEEVKEGLTEDDAVPEVTESICKLGDLWELGEHRVLCGDSTKAENVKRLMNGEKAELLFTSPPYSDMRDYNDGKDLSINNLVNFIPTYYDYANYQVINLGIQRKEHEIFEYWNNYILKAKETGYKFLSWNVWNRETAKSIGQMTAMFPIEHEWIFVFGKEKKSLNCTIKNKYAGHINNYTTSRGKDGRTKKMPTQKVRDKRELGTVLTMQTQMARNIDQSHPASFPVSFPEEYIKAMTNENDNVIDPFLGSGSTLIACEKTGRRCFGCEIDPHYCDVIIERWQDFSGGEARKI